METLRSFIAVPLSEEVKAAVGALQRELQTLPGDVRWTPPRNFHLTLKFLGPVPRPRLEEVQEVCAQEAAKVAPFRLELKGLGVFPHFRRPRVIWVGVEAGREELALLATALERELAQRGFAAEKRPYHPHLTLGRFRSSRQQQPLIRALQERQEVALGADEVRVVHLMQSILQPSGAEYHLLAEFALGSLG